ncbi:hypothetical protein NIES22_73820 (plasmid) [Calothrix brevissima NIES-22]|nr:hypothetical protein NIES22_73820 [Calothrix brevissima NIES-22]
MGTAKQYLAFLLTIGILTAFWITDIQLKSDRPSDQEVSDRH